MQDGPVVQGKANGRPRARNEGLGQGGPAHLACARDRQDGEDSEGRPDKGLAMPPITFENLTPNVRFSDKYFVPERVGQEGRRAAEPDWPLS